MPSIALTGAPAAPVNTPTGVVGVPNNFASLTTAQAAAWSKNLWQTVRQKSFVMANTGSTFNSVFMRVTELTKNAKGTQAIMTLVPDLDSEGVNGNGFIEGREKALDAEEQQILIDQLREANKSKGRMSEQATVVNFRNTSRDKLGYWMADSIDQLAATLLSGWPTALKTNGALRTSFTVPGNVPTLAAGVDADMTFAGLDFMNNATGVGGIGQASPLTNNRVFYIDSAGVLTAGTGADKANFTSASVVKYEHFIDLKATLADRRLQAIQGDMGTAMYHVLVHPKVMATLKKDPTFLSNVRQGSARGPNNPLFTGAIPTIDGMVFHEWTHCINTLGANMGANASGLGNLGDKWGTDGQVDGSRVLFLGAQALGIADLGAPTWDERDHFDYGDKPGIAISKMFGLLRPRFTSAQDGSIEEYGVATLDVAI